MRRLRLGSFAVLGFSILAAFGVRVIPSYNLVFTKTGVNFQDTDSWYHMRSVHNVAAHFPRQSGFDPYAVFPAWQNAYTEPWDLFIAGVAWVPAFGNPSEHLVNQVGAWLPAILGALLPIPLFFLARRLFGETAACWTAVATAALPGTFLWETHLGVPDHHIAECLLSLCALLLLCGAIESQGRERLWRNAGAGLLFGVYLCVRPAGIFVPALLAIATIFEPLLAPFVATCLVLAGGVFLGSSGSIWESFTWLTLAGCMAVCLLAWGVGAFWRKRAWPRALYLPAVGVAAGIAIGILAGVQPAVFAAMVERVGRYLPGSSVANQNYSVGELIPMWMFPSEGLHGLFEVLGGVWLPAFPVLLCGIYAIWRSRRPALVLCAVWGVVMTVGGVLQVRMWIYGGPAVAVAAGAGCAWLLAEVPRLRTALSLLTAGFLLAVSIPHGRTMVGHDGGPSPEWRSALKWLRGNTPEPMGDANAWVRYWPALKPGQQFAYPPSAYGVLTWWDYGDWVNAIAHRIPSTNGTQRNAETVAEFLTSTSPEAAQGLLTRLSVRYAVLNPEVTDRLWDPVVQWASRDGNRFQRIVFLSNGKGKPVPVRIYLPDFYRTMAVRLYHFDGEAVKAPKEISIFLTKRLRTGNGPELDTVYGERKFPSEEAAVEFAKKKSIQMNTGESMIFGSNNSLVSCVDVPALPWAKRVYASPEYGGPTSVKVFEVKR